jgi:methyltransferase family protein
LDIVMSQPKPATPDSTVTPDAILQLGLAFWGSKTLLSAVELGLFTLLADGPLSVEAVTARLALHPRSVPTSSMHWSHWVSSSAKTGFMPTPPPVRCFSTDASRPMSAAFSRWRMHGSIRSGAR